MDTMPTTDQPATDGHRDARGRAALHELGELLQLRQRPVLVGVALVVVLGLVVALAAPTVLPATALTGALVGLLALLVGSVAAVLVDGADPVLRGSRHLRRDGHTVLPRLASEDVEQDGEPLLAALRRRVANTERVRLAITSVGGLDPRGIAEGIGRAAAGSGVTSLVIDLRTVTGRPGIAEVGTGEARLGEAATLAGDRPFAAIGAGADRDAAIGAAAALAQRPPSDLQLLLVVEPELAVGMEALHEAVDKVVLLAPADKVGRDEVTQRVAALRRSGAAVECVVVGGAGGTTAGVPGVRPFTAAAPAAQPAAPAAADDLVPATPDHDQGDAPAARDGQPFVPLDPEPSAPPTGADEPSEALGAVTPDEPTDWASSTGTVQVRRLEGVPPVEEPAEEFPDEPADEPVDSRRDLAAGIAEPAPAVEAAAGDGADEVIDVTPEVADAVEDDPAAWVLDTDDPDTTADGSDEEPAPAPAPPGGLLAGGAWDDSTTDDATWAAPPSPVPAPPPAADEPPAVDEAATVDESPAADEAPALTLARPDAPYPLPPAAPYPVPPVAAPEPPVPVAAPEQVPPVSAPEPVPPVAAPEPPVPPVAEPVASPDPQAGTVEPPVASDGDALGDEPHETVAVPAAHEAPPGGDPTEDLATAAALDALAQRLDPDGV